MDPKPKTKQDDYRDEFTEEELEELRRLYEQTPKVIEDPVEIEATRRSAEKWMAILGSEDDEPVENRGER
jgi:hypothetical protein